MPEYPRLDLAAQRPGLGHCVYRLLDDAAILLYIGSTGNIWYRIGQHAAERPWWPEVAWDRTIVECISETRCPGRSCRLAVHAEMTSYEARLIMDLRPRYNKLSTGYCRSGRHLLADHGKADGRCGACISEKLHSYYVANRAKALADASAYYYANREKILARKRRRAAAPPPGQQALNDL